MWEPISRWFSDQFVAAQSGFDSAVAALIPPVPSAVAAAAPCATLSGVISEGAWIGRFVPLGLLAVAVGVLVVAIVASIAIRLVRIAISLGTFGGGA